MSTSRRAVPRWVPAALVVLAAALPLLPTLRAGFIYDDTTIIRDNAWLRGWSALAHAWHQPYWPNAGLDVGGLYRPVHVALLAAVWNAAGGAPLAFHSYALALYVLVVVLAWRLLRRATFGIPAALGALWLATHPLHVEAVASAANTAELLVAACTIALAFLLARADGRGAARADGWGIALAGAALSAAALLSKESGIVALPLAAVTAWGWRAPAERIAARELARRHSRLWLASGGAIVAALLARAVVLGAPVSRVSIAAPGLDTLGPVERATAVVSVWPRIAGTIAWPATLSPYYGPTVLPARRVALALLALVASAALLAGCIVLARRGDRRPLAALAWMALTYLPASNLVTAAGPIVSDRTLFGATIGGAMLLAWGVDRLPRRAWFAAALALALLAARNAMHTARYARVWTSHRTLWEQLVRASPGEYRGWELLGIDATARGDRARAVSLLAHAFAMEPRDRRLRFEYGQALYAAGRYGDAAGVLAPLLAATEVRRERDFVAMYLDAVGRSRGVEAVVAAGTPLLRGEAAAVAALFVGAAQERLGRLAAADSVYALGLREAPADTLLRARRAALEARLPAR
ncbi:MAG TPA: tetratricopeptide repeat protein [Gemmatimonadaceae bacterium]|nr:tetratricopeptide repeat protein [Gemmatimonadaceae bacterium]